MSIPPDASHPPPPRSNGRRPRLRPTPEQIGAYRAAFQHFNRALFAGELPEVLLKFGRLDSAANELSLNPDYLVDKTPREAAVVLVHEMCHVWRHLHGEPPRRGYHDRAWADKMLSIGLTPSTTGAPGGKTIGDKIGTLINNAGPFVNAFATLPNADLLPWHSSGDEQRKRVDPSKLAYTCGCSKAWGKRGLSMKCLKCGNTFAVVEGD